MALPKISMTGVKLVGYTKSPKDCEHYPIIGLAAKTCWIDLERDMHHRVRQCTHCGLVEVDYFTSYSNVTFNDAWRRKKDAAKNNPDAFQPWVDGKPNEKFAKAYAHNTELLKNTYTASDLKQLGMPKLAEVKSSKPKDAPTSGT
jgi:hypothetical protein